MSIHASVNPDEKYDKNQLDDKSVKFARYFAMSNFEVQFIKKRYNELVSDTTHGVKVTPFKLIKMLGLRSLPLHEHLFSIYDGTYFDWNSYFQFVVFFSFSPMVCIFFSIINTFPSFTGQVSWEDIVLFFQLLRRQSGVCKDVQLIFQDFDINSDGYLSLNQFWNFISVTIKYWEPLFMFRILLINGVFGVERLKSIMDRRCRINVIKQYQVVHDQKLPKEPCLSKFKRSLQGLPHPDLYDYDPCTTLPNGQLSYLQYAEIVTMFIKKYKPLYVMYHEGFAMKNLGRFIDHPTICLIDKYFIEYRNNSPEYVASQKRRSTTNSNHSNLSLTPPPEGQQFESSKSILKRPSHPSERLRSRTSLLPKDRKQSVSEMQTNTSTLPETLSNYGNLNSDGGNGQIQLALNSYKNEPFPSIEPVHEYL